MCHAGDDALCSALLLLFVNPSLLLAAKVTLHLVTYTTDCTNRIHFCTLQLHAYTALNQCRFKTSPNCMAKRCKMLTKVPDAMRRGEMSTMLMRFDRVFPFVF